MAPSLSLPSQNQKSETSCYEAHYMSIKTNTFAIRRTGVLALHSLQTAYRGVFLCAIQCAFAASVKRCSSIATLQACSRKSYIMSAVFGCHQ